MASTEFVAVSWQPNELIDEDSLDQISNNLTFLRNQMIDGKYQQLEGGGIVDIGIKMLCGRSLVAPRKSDTATITINFANMFTPNTQPVVTTSLTSASKVQIYHVINGIGRFHPSDQGFQAKVQVTSNSNKKVKIQQNICVNWIAMGT